MMMTIESNRECFYPECTINTLFSRVLINHAYVLENYIEVFHREEIAKKPLAI